MKESTIFALGFFDGVHLGHQALLKACRELAQQHSCQAGVVTFAAHPDALVLGKAPVLITATEDRKRLLHAYGAKLVWELPFDKEIMTTHWADFLTQLVEAGAKGFVCGEDFRFGAGGLGTAKKLEAYCKKRNLPYAIVPEQIMDGERISSTRIRSLLEQGEVAAANRLLGHPHILSGVVAEGKQLGRTLGFPTANLPLPAGVLVPKCGVYATKVVVGETGYPAVTNVGVRPTVNGEGVNAECHLIDFTGDLYGKEITVAFHSFLRPEQKFDSLEALKAQIAADTAQARKML